MIAVSLTTRHEHTDPLTRPPGLCLFVIHSIIIPGQLTAQRIGKTIVLGCVPFVRRGDVLRPGRSRLCGERHVVTGTGRRLVGQVGGKNGQSVVFDQDRVVLGHVDGRRELAVA